MKPHPTESVSNQSTMWPPLCETRCLGINKLSKKEFFKILLKAYIQQHNYYSFCKGNRIIKGGGGETQWMGKRSVIEKHEMAIHFNGSYTCTEFF